MILGIITLEDNGVRRYGMWLILSILSAFFAAVTSILAKIGIENVNSNLATAIRTLVVVIMSWLIVFITNAQTGIHDISNKSWMFLILSGLATGLSWLCYYAAIKSGQVSKVVAVDKASVILTFIMAFIFLGEKFTLKSIIGAILIGIGTFIMVI